MVIHIATLFCIFYSISSFSNCVYLRKFLPFSYKDAKSNTTFFIWLVASTGKGGTLSTAFTKERGIPSLVGRKWGVGGFAAKRKRHEDDAVGEKRSLAGSEGREG